MNLNREAAERTYEVVEAFWKALDGKSPTERSAALAMVVATWLAAHRGDERQKALNHHLEVVGLVLPDLVARFGRHDA